MSAARERLLRAATSTWAADPSASLDAIAQAAGVGRATLHRHFSSRAELMRSVALDGIGALSSTLDAARLTERPPAEALEALINLLVPFGERLHFLLVAVDLGGNSEVAAAEECVDAPIRRVLDRAAEAGLLRAEVPKAWRFRALESLLYASWIAVASGEIARLDAPGLVRDAFIRGFGHTSLSQP